MRPDSYGAGEEGFSGGAAGISVRQVRVAACFSLAECRVTRSMCSVELWAQALRRLLPPLMPKRDKTKQNSLNIEHLAAGGFESQMFSFLVGQ